MLQQTFFVERGSYVADICPLTQSLAAVSATDTSLRLLDLSANALSAPLPVQCSSTPALNAWGPNELLIITNDLIALHDVRQQALAAVLVSPASHSANKRKFPYLTGAVSPANSVLAVGTELVKSDALVELWSARVCLYCRPLHDRLCVCVCKGT